MDTIDSAKQILRNNLLNRRKNFVEYLYNEANENIISHLLKLINLLTNDSKSSHNIIALYWPLNGEPNLKKFFSLKNFNCALPRIDDYNLKYVSYKDGDQLERAKLGGFCQPYDKNEIFPNLIIIPGLAFSTQGYRLGFGQGYYDRYLFRFKQKYHFTTIGVCFHDGLFQCLPFNENDHKLDFILTDKILVKL